MNQTLNATPDVVIIGGGVAGAGLATVLARAGHGVIVVERAPRFIDRIRGEFVHPWGVREMARVGLLDTAVSRANARILPCWAKYHDREPGDPYRWSDDFPDIPGSLSVSHPALQRVLLHEAVNAGATPLRPATVADIVWNGGQPKVTVDTNMGNMTFTPRLVVGADGAHSVVRRHLGGAGISDPPHHAIGGTIIKGTDLPTDSAHQAYFEGGFAMIFPQSDDLSRVYYVCSTEQAEVLQRAEPDVLIDRLRAVLPDGALQNATIVGPTGFFPNSETLATVTHGPRTVLIGDAAGSNDPSQGHGLSLVFRDIRDIAERLALTEDWSTIPDAFAEARSHDHKVLRAHAHWVAPLSTETGPEIDQLRQRIERAREADPTAGGFAGIFATGPATLVADEKARRHFFGDDLESNSAI